MTDQARSITSLEPRLERALRAYGTSAIRPFDADAIAQTAVLLDRRRAARPQWALLAAAALLGALLLAGIAALVGGYRPWLTVAPTSTTNLEVPSEVLAHWVGAPREIAGSGRVTGLRLGSSSLCAEGGSPASACLRLVSAMTAAGPDVISVAATGTDGDCPLGAVGRYRWTVSPVGTRLSLALEADPCQARAAALPGTWYRVGCRNPADDCLGLLDAGTYPSQFVAPRLPVGGTWSADFGAVTYTVPDGWANSGDWSVLLALTPAADYALETQDGQAIGRYQELDVFAHPAPARQAGRCDGTVDETVASTAQAFATWLHAQPAFAVSATTSLTVAGHPAYAQDIRLAPGYLGTCPDAPGPAADYLVLRDDLDPDHGFTPRLRGAEVHRLILVDLGDGAVVAIVIDSSDPARFDALVAASMPIVDSLAIR